ncbi:CPBP family intramembrane metalloprotease [Microbacterium sp. HD4P20]|uniref:CPBP family intramembrane glutamic endopeptidase n=1 Tax=Microbacterium sp. HD4P20 TaxID=2864874 RepID=UPI001C642DCB|nr:CPBP family intramembrane glutamic endopeptidase [Microbacterium sp. HD4P20]MCP2638122.1 CPBP family intramembrane metalloprotease [Microbacterium sp. HD4P20]
MLDQPSDLATGSTPPATRAGRRSGSGRQPRTDWRLGGRTVRAWREGLLAVALISLGIALLAGTLIDTLWESPLAGPVALALMWIGMLVPVVLALTRSRPIGLLRVRWIDLLYGVALALLLRLMQGWLAQGLGGDRSLPSVTLVDGRLPTSWWLTDGLASIVIAAPLEEFFFHAVVLVALYTLMRRPFGKTAAGVVAGLVSTALFVTLHALAGGALPVDQVVSLLLLGLTCAALVLLTGRIWGAVIVHALFNATWVVLVVLGTIWG